MTNKRKIKSSNKIGNSKSSLLTKIFTGFVTEIYKTFKFFGLGLIKVLDFIFTKLITLFSYIIYAFVYAFEYIGKFTYKLGYVVYYYFLKIIFVEMYELIKAVFLGFYKFVKLIFYEIPSFIVKAFSDLLTSISKKTKTTNERLTYFFKHTPNKIKDYFIDKWNNISIVKHYRNKKERELEVLLIDKNGVDAERTDKKQTYEYLARNSDGKLVKGYFAALSKLDVHSYLLDAGFEVYEIRTNKWINLVHNENRYLEKPMRNKDLIFWLAQLSTYIKSGIPLTDAVKILSEQDKRKKYRKVYDSVIYELSMGESFSEALRKQGNVFPPLLINMVKAAELIGDLESTLDEMSEYYEEKDVTRKQLIGAVTYPTIILIFAIGVITFMMIYVIPQFEEVYNGLGANITGITLVLLNVSRFLKSNIGIILSSIVILVFVIRLLYKRVKAFRTILQYFAMHIPVIGKLIIYNEMNLFAKTFAVLNKNNILLTDSIDILSKITNNEFYKMLMYDTISNLLRGDKISLSFKDNWCVPPLAYYMITTGESTGELSSMLERVSEYYQREQRTLANTLKTLIEPILMIFLAVIVGTIMVSILMPMYDISHTILQ